MIFFGPKAKLVLRYHMDHFYFHIAVREQDFEFRIPPAPFSTFRLPSIQSASKTSFQRTFTRRTRRNFLGILRSVKLSFSPCSRYTRSVSHYYYHLSSSYPACPRLQSSLEVRGSNPGGNMVFPTCPNQPLGSPNVGIGWDGIVVIAMGLQRARRSRDRFPVWGGGAIFRIGPDLP